jgi:hypothetical protein
MFEQKEFFTLVSWLSQCLLCLNILSFPIFSLDYFLESDFLPFGLTIFPEALRFLSVDLSKRSYSLRKAHHLILSRWNHFFAK